MALEELSFKRVNGRTHGRRTKVITIAHPGHSSGELKSKFFPFGVRGPFSEGTWCAGMQIIVCIEVLRPSQRIGVMSSVVSLPNHTFTGQA